jgi:hypothetical protein
MMAKDLDLGAIEARAAAATPGPWEAKRDGEGGSLVRMPDGDSARVTGVDDAIFIANARTDVPALVAAVRERDEQIAVLKREIEDLGWTLAEAAEGRGPESA